MNQWKRYTGPAMTTLLVLSADRLTKNWAAQRLASRGPVAAIAGLIGWRYAENTGVAFSFLTGNGFAVCLVTALIIAAALIWLLRHPSCGGWTKAGLSLLVAGGLGNLYDRVRYGYVIDFIETLFMHFPIFNVADMAVVAGTLCLMVGILRAEGKTSASVSDRR